eukprot:scaffold4892_cov97-Skeletonema_marinoi.AAC.1
MHLEAEIKTIALPLQQHEMMKNENQMCGGACKGETIGEKPDMQTKTTGPGQFLPPITKKTHTM